MLPTKFEILAFGVPSRIYFYHSLMIKITVLHEKKILCIFFADIFKSESFAER